MSHFTTVQTQITNPEQLVKALEEAFGWQAIYNSNGQALEDWLGKDCSLLSPDHLNYAPLCQVRVPREQIGRLKNDAGFYQNPDGTYTAKVDGFTPEQQSKLLQAYAHQGVLTAAAAQGLEIVQDQSCQGQIIYVLQQKTSAKKTIFA